MSGLGREPAQWRSGSFGDFKFSGAAPHHAGERGVAALPSMNSMSNGVGHARHHSFTPPTTGSLVRTGSRRNRSSSLRASSLASGTFAPQFIKSEELQGKKEQVNHIEGENDFSGKRYVWLKDPEKAFVQGWIVQELSGEKLLVQCDDGSVGCTSLDGLRKLIPLNSKEKFTRRASTRSIRPSSTKPVIWRN